MVSTLELILDLVIFQIEGKEYCADTRRVNAILKPEEIAYVAGIKTIRSALILRDNKEYVLINLRKFLNLPEQKFSTETRAVLMELDDQRIAFFVDRVIEIISLDVNSAYVQKVSGEEDFINSIIRYEQRDFLVPDFKKISANAQENS